MTGKVIGKDKWSDLAVVKAKVADENIKPMTMGILIILNWLNLF